VVIANPPYGANIDEMVKVYAKLYPNTTRSFRDIYKIFIELGLKKLTCDKGILCYIVPNTLLFQPRYKDARKYLLNFRLREILNLGGGVFENVVIYNCIIFIQNDSPEGNFVKFGDLSTKPKREIKSIIQNIAYSSLPQEIYYRTPDNILVSKFIETKNNEELLKDILYFKDAGINYQRVSVGLSQKGKSDLGKRLLYEGKKENSQDVEFWKGEDIDSYFIKASTNRFVRLSTLKHLRNNERVVLNKEYFSLKPKLLWRQTAPYPVVALDVRGIWFGRSIQSARIKKGKENEYDYKYLLALLNSKYLRYVYSLLVKESGRVFPQVKLSKLKYLPIKKISLSKQKPFINLVSQILSLTQSEDYLENPQKQAKVKEYQRQIDQLVYELYELTDEEIRIVEDF